MESISNPLLRVGEIDKIAAIANEAGAALVVDNTFATPLLARPLELGAHFSVHSVTKYLAGHGDVLGGVVVTNQRARRFTARVGAHHRPRAGPVRMLPDHARHQDVPAAHGAAVRQRLPGGVVAGRASACGAGVFHRRSAASRRRRHPATVPRRALRRHGQLRSYATRAGKRSSASWTGSR